MHTNLYNEYTFKYRFFLCVLSLFPIYVQLQLRRQSQFNARKKFHYAIMCVRAMVRIKRLRYTLEPLKVEDAMCDPYRVKILRKVGGINIVF